MANRFVRGERLVIVTRVIKSGWEISTVHHRLDMGGRSDWNSSFPYRTTARRRVGDNLFAEPGILVGSWRNAHKAREGHATVVAGVGCGWEPVPHDDSEEVRDIAPTADKNNKQETE